MGLVIVVSDCFLMLCIVSVDVWICPAFGFLWCSLCLPGSKNCEKSELVFALLVKRYRSVHAVYLRLLRVLQTLHSVRTNQRAYTVLLIIFLANTTVPSSARFEWLIVKLTQQTKGSFANSAGFVLGALSGQWNKTYFMFDKKRVLYIFIRCQYDVECEVVCRL